MRQSQRAHAPADRPLLDDDPTDELPLLDERGVLDMLERDAAERDAAVDDEPYRPLKGLRNGLLIGLGFWALVLAVLGVLSGLGYL